MEHVLANAGEPAAGCWDRPTYVDSDGEEFYDEWEDDDSPGFSEGAEGAKVQDNASACVESAGTALSERASERVSSTTGASSGAVSSSSSRPTPDGGGGTVEVGDTNHFGVVGSDFGRLTQLHHAATAGPPPPAHSAALKKERVRVADGAREASDGDGAVFRPVVPQGEAAMGSGLGGAAPIDKVVAEEVEAAVKATLPWLGVELWSLEFAADTTVQLWQGVSVKDSLEDKRLKLAVIARLGDAMMTRTGSHVTVAKYLRRAYRKAYGDHLDPERINQMPGLSEEVREKCMDIAARGVSAEEVKPRWNLRHRMDAKVAEEHGLEAVDKVIKDGVWGRILLLTTSVRRELLDDEDKVMLCKLIRVAKRNLQGYEIEGEGRFCHAQIEANEITPSDGIGVGGKVRLPRVKDALEDVAYLAAVYPGLEIRASKADVSSAFKLLWLMEELCGLFACAIPMSVLGLGLGDFIVCNLVLTFGSAISPGNYDFFSKAIEMGHRAHCPPVPRRDGTSRFRSNTLVDDGVIVGVSLGASMRYSAATYLWNMRMALGKEAVNIDKHREEGPFLSRQILWGIGVDMGRSHLNVLDTSLWLTQSKLAKAKALVFNPLFDYGSVSFGKWQAKVLAGNVVFWANLCPPMWAVLMRISSAMRGLPEGKVGPTGELSEGEQCAYKLMWEAVELLRVIVGQPDWWSATMTASFASVLTLRERLAMRGAEEGVVWTGGDANLYGCAMGSWTDLVYDVIEVEVWKPRLKVWMDESCPGYDTKTFVAIWELLCFVAVCTYCAPLWAGKIVIYVSDNQNVEAWLTNLRAGTPVANHLCLLVSLIMCRMKFSLYSFYINTDLNSWDRPSRIHDPIAERKYDGFGVEGLDAFMAEVFPGLKRVNMSESLEFYIGNGMRGVLEMFGHVDPTARALAEQRVLSAGRPLSCQGLVAIDLLAGSGTCSAHFRAKGGVIRGIVEWHPAARALYRLAVGPVPHVVDFWSNDIAALPPDGVEVAIATPNCQSYSDASGAPKGLNDVRGWMLPDTPGKYVTFTNLLATLLENVWGAVSAHGGQVWELYCQGMSVLDHLVWPAERVCAPELGGRVMSTRLIAQSERKRMAAALGKLPSISLPAMRPRRAIREALLPVEEVRRRLWECVIEVDHATIRWAPQVVTGTRRPAALGHVTFTGRGDDGKVVRGALVTMKPRVGAMVDTEKRWRVQAVYRDGRLELWAPGRTTIASAAQVDTHAFDGVVLSIASVGNRPTVIGERPGGPGKGWYYDDRFSPPVLRALLGEECCLAVGKPLSWLKAWQARAQEEAADPTLPRTVPPYEEALKFMLAGNSVEWSMSEAAVERIGARVTEFKRLVSTGAEAPIEPWSGDAPTYSPEVREWRERIMADARSGRPTDSYGIDDSHLEVSLAAREAAEGGDWARQLQEAAGAALLESDATGLFGPCPPAAGGRGQFALPPVGERVGGSSEGEAPAVVRRAQRVRKQNARLTTGRGGQWAGVADNADNRTNRPSRSSSGTARGAKGERGADATRGRRERSSSRPAKSPGEKEDSGDGVGESSSALSESSASVAKPAKRGKTKPAAKADGRSARSHVNSSRRAKPDASVPPKRRHRPASKPTGKDKVRKKDGFGIVGLEARAAIERGDWDAFERLVTVKLPMHSVAWGTLNAYQPGWKQWVSFCFLRGFSPFLEVETTAEKKEASRRLLLFVGVCAFGMGEKSSTIKGKLMAIRFMHLAFDRENPIDKLPRVWMAYRAIKRWEAPTERKHPVTPEMCDRMDAKERKKYGKRGIVGVIKRAARYFALFLCCRASEYLAPVSPEKIMLVGDVMPMAGRRYTDWSDPAVDGIMARFRSSKTDQYNEGALRYVGKTTNSRCVVKALIEWYALDSAHFEEHDDRPMFRYPNGKVMTREEMQHDLREAAVDCEIDEQRFGTHSWRVSGATWLYQAGYDIETIKRHGRWTSGVVHVYLWEGTGQQGLAAKMSAVDFVIHAQLPR